MRYRVEKANEDGRDYLYVRGLPSQGLDGTEPDTRLMHINGYGEPSYQIEDAKMMHEVLYDLFQVHDSLKDGDRFTTPFGEFVCRGVHVEPWVQSDEDVLLEESVRTELIDAGWSQPDAFLFASVMEGASNEKPEDEALRIMDGLRLKYKGEVPRG